MKHGLVLEGGAMRGLFTAGVLDIFMENGIDFDGTVGVSAGATFGCNIKSRQPGRTIRYNLRFAKESHYGSFRSLITTGDYYNEEFCYHKVPEELDLFDTETFEANPMVFYVVATDVATGRPVYQKLKDGKREDLKWIQASASMPIFARPVSIEGRLYLDGGISDSIPLRFMEREGYQKNVVVLTRPKGYLKKPSSLQPQMNRLLKKYPAIIREMNRRPSNYNNILRYVALQEEAGEAFVIRPPEALPVSRIEHDTEKMRQAYEIGRAEALRRLPELREYLR